MKAKNLIFGAVALAIAAPLWALPTFTFNGIPLSANTTDGLGGYADSTAIKNYMNSVIGCAPACVSSVTGALATANYNADGFGYKFPSGDPQAGQYMTLGTTDHATSFSNTAAEDGASPGNGDEFIMNDNIVSGSNSITITFSSNLPIGTVVSYDWQIFPDGSSEQPPGLNFVGGGINNSIFGSTPPGGGAMQGIGISPSFILTSATNTLQWNDWPAEVGIDNLSILPPLLKTVPEPSPLPLTGLALALLALLRWKAAGRTNARALT
jgi:hypothetical protein